MSRSDLLGIIEVASSIHFLSSIRHADPLSPPCFDRPHPLLPFQIERYNPSNGCSRAGDVGLLCSPYSVLSLAIEGGEYFGTGSKEARL